MKVSLLSYLPFLVILLICHCHVFYVLCCHLLHTHVTIKQSITILRFVVCLSVVIGFRSSVLRRASLSHLVFIMAAENLCCLWIPLVVRV